MISDAIADMVERILRIISIVVGLVGPAVGGLYWFQKLRKSRIQKEEADSKTAVVSTELAIQNVRRVDAEVHKVHSDTLIQLVNELQEELKIVRDELKAERAQRMTESNALQEEITKLRVRISASEYRSDNFHKGIKILLGQLKDNNITPLWTPTDTDNK